jgi:membrane protein DedA with SNARE-associated domain
MSEFLQTHGYWAIMAVLILTGSGLPIPEEVPIIAAGILASPAGDHVLNPWGALACCVCGAIAGDAIMYWIGYHFGRGVLREHRWWARFVTPKRECQVERMFERHGLKLFFVTRFLVALRSPVYLTAGILRVSFRRFLLIDLVCASAVVSTFFGLAYYLSAHISGADIRKLIHRGELSVTIAAVLAIAAVAFYLWRRYRRKYPLANLPCPGEADPPPPKPKKP